jgi:hypothetical protein
MTKDKRDSDLTIEEIGLIVTLARERLTVYISDQTRREVDREYAASLLPPPVLQWLDSLLNSFTTYRDSLLTLLAIPLVKDTAGIDLREAPDGARGAGSAISLLLREELHIPARKDAFQTMGKGSRLVIGRRKEPDFDLLIKWASDEASIKDISATYQYVITSLARTARTVAPMPRLRLADLTFVEVMGLLDEMLNVNSGGAHEQYITAAFLHAVVEQAHAGLRIETKGINVSDTSSRKAGDVEVIGAGGLQDALEVTSNDWATKLSQARDALRGHRLRRAHILGHLDADAYKTMASHIGRDEDISVLDVRALSSVLVALLGVSGRDLALRELYRLLDQNLTDPALVNAYVGRLMNRNLTETSEPATFEPC